VTNKYVAAWV